MSRRELYKVRFVADLRWKGDQFAEACEEVLAELSDYDIEHVIHCTHGEAEAKLRYTMDGDRYVGGGGGGGTWGVLIFLRLSDEARYGEFMPSPPTIKMPTPADDDNEEGDGDGE